MPRLAPIDIRIVTPAPAIPATLAIPDDEAAPLPGTTVNLYRAAHPDDGYGDSRISRPLSSLGRPAVARHAAASSRRGARLRGLCRRRCAGDRRRDGRGPDRAGLRLRASRRRCASGTTRGCAGGASSPCSVCPRRGSLRPRPPYLRPRAEIRGPSRPRAPPEVHGRKDHRPLLPQNVFPVGSAAVSHNGQPRFRRSWADHPASDGRPP
jgi:hypothetical protein